MSGTRIKPDISGGGDRLSAMQGTYAAVFRDGGPISTNELNTTFINVSGSTSTFLLPAVSDANKGKFVRLTKFGVGPCIITPPVSAVLADGASGQSMGNLTGQNFAFVEFIVRSGAQWDLSSALGHWAHI